MFSSSLCRYGLLLRKSYMSLWSLLRSHDYDSKNPHSYNPPITLCWCIWFSLRTWHLAFFQAHFLFNVSLHRLASETYPHVHYLLQNGQNYDIMRSTTSHSLGFFLFVISDMFILLKMTPTIPSATLRVMSLCNCISCTVQRGYCNLLSECLSVCM